MTFGLFLLLPAAKMPVVEPRSILQRFPMASRARGQVWLHQPAYWRPRHFHPETELNFVSRGRACMALGSGTVELEHGSVVWFLPGRSHELLDASPDLELWAIGASPDFAEAIGVGPSSMAAGRQWHRHLSPEATAGLTRRCRATLEGTCTAGTEESLAGILECAKAGFAPPPSSPFDPLVARALQLLLACPSSSRHSLAGRLRVSESELSRRFHAQIGVPFREYRHRVRVLEFIQRVGEGQHNLMRAALTAGFGSYSQCFRAFEHVVGQSPRVYWRDGRNVLDAVLSTQGTRD